MARITITINDSDGGAVVSVEFDPPLEEIDDPSWSAAHLLAARMLDVLMEKEMKKPEVNVTSN